MKKEDGVALEEVLALVGGRYYCPAEAVTASSDVSAVVVRHLVPLEHVLATAAVESTKWQQSISFLANKSYLKQVTEIRGLAALIVDQEFPSCPCAQIVVPDAYAAFAQLTKVFYDIICDRAEAQRGPSTPQIHPQAQVDAGVHLGAGVQVGAHCRIGAGCFLGDDVTIGDHTIIEPRVTIHRRSDIGQSCVIQSGVVIGSDGFGFATLKSRSTRVKIYHLGNVRIEDDVEIGSLSNVDRAVLGTTVVGAGTKIDSLVQIAHNVRIGKNNVICAQCAFAGSSRTGDDVTLAGCVRVNNRVHIAAGSRVGPMSVARRNIVQKGDYMGYPLMPALKWMKYQSALQQVSRRFLRTRHH